MMLLLLACSSPSAPTPKPPAFELLAPVGGRLWLPVHAPEAVLLNAVATAAAPEATSPAYDAWRQPFKTERIGTVAREQRYHALNVATGEGIDCTVDAFAVLTLGVPATLPAEEELKQPACGSPALYAVLTCPGDGAHPDGPWVGAPADVPLAARDAGKDPAPTSGEVVGGVTVGGVDATVTRTPPHGATLVPLDGSAARTLDWPDCRAK